MSVAHEDPGPDKTTTKSLICFEKCAGSDELRDPVEKVSVDVSDSLGPDRDHSFGEGVPHGLKTEPSSKDSPGCAR